MRLGPAWPASWANSMPEPSFPLIEAYLGVLHAYLGEQTPGRERILTEAEDHLRTAAEQAIADGLTVDEAQRQAVERFGPAQTVAAAFLDAYALPRVFDARHGLSGPALAELARATRLALAPRGTRDPRRPEAVLGYWVPESGGERFGAILLRSRSHLPPGAQPVVLANLERNEWWRTTVVPHLRPGMQLHAEFWDGKLRLWYGPFPNAPAARQQRYVSFLRRGPQPPRKCVPVRHQ
jgi:hypothetical protein